MRGASITRCSCSKGTVYTYRKWCATQSASGSGTDLRAAFHCGLCGYGADIISMNASPPAISVVMAMYNAESYLREAIESILAQTFIDFEFVIVDDGSTDESVVIAESYGDPRVRVLREPHRGLVPSLNHGFGVSRGRYIARMDADDVSLPDRLRQQHDYLLAHPDIALLGTWYTKGYPHTKATYRVPVGDYRIKYALFDENVFCHGTVMLRAEILQETGAYRRILVEDYDLWLRISEISRVAILPRILYRYRVHAGQITQNPGVSLRNDGFLHALSLAKQRCLFGSDSLGYATPAGHDKAPLTTMCHAFALHAIWKRDLNLTLRLLGASLRRDPIGTIAATADPGFIRTLLAWAVRVARAVPRRAHRTLRGRLI